MTVPPGPALHMKACFLTTFHSNYFQGILTAITQQLTYLYKLNLAHSKMKTQRYQKGWACGKNKAAIITRKKQAIFHILSINIPMSILPHIHLLESSCLGNKD